MLGKLSDPAAAECAAAEESSADEAVTGSRPLLVILGPWQLVTHNGDVLILT